MLTDGVSVFVERTGALINATRSGQLAMRKLMEAHLRRIDPDVDGLAIRLFPFVRHDLHTTRSPSRHSPPSRGSSHWIHAYASAGG